jgi:glutathione S-transferase
VPSAVDDGPTITESNAILMYAADRDGVDSAYPKNLKQRAEVNRWLLWESCAWFPSCYKYLVEYVVKPLLQAEPDQKVIDEEAPNWNKLAKLFDDQLAKSKWLVGEQPTIVDIAVATPIHLWEAQRLPLDQYLNLKRWMTEGVEKLPCWQKTQGAVDKALLLNKAQSAGAANGTVNGQSEVRSTLNYTKDLSPKLTEPYSTSLELPSLFTSPGMTRTRFLSLMVGIERRSFRSTRKGFRCTTSRLGSASGKMKRRPGQTSIRRLSSS